MAIANQKPKTKNPLGQWLVWCRAPLFTGLLLWLSFPPVGWSFLAWIALVPLTTLVRVPWRSRPVYRVAWVGGLAFGLLAVQWIRYADDIGLTGYYGWWALALYLSLYFPLFLLFMRVAVLRFRCPAIIAVPVVWVGLEYLRSWLLTGFPWYFLAHAQFQYIHLIQIADLAGAYGVSFVVALVNGWLIDLLSVPLMRPSEAGQRLAREQVWRLSVVIVSLLLVFAYGMMRLAYAGGKPGPTVALIQTNVPQKVKEDESQFDEIRRQYLKLLGELAEIGSDSFQLVIWPETAYLFGIYEAAADRFPLLEIESGTTDDELRRLFPNADVDPAKIRRIAAVVRVDLTKLAQRTGVPVLMGLNTEHLGYGRRQLYNSAVLVAPDGSFSAAYHKIHLVPWGEYLPLRGWLPWLHVLTPHASADYGLEAGTGPVPFPWNGYRLGVLICFEDTVPWAARSYMDPDPVDILVNITNDGWFGVADELSEPVGLFQRAEHEAHLAISVFRAVECRRPLVRAVNTGISAIIDSSGRQIRVAGGGLAGNNMRAQVAIGSVPLDHRRSFYAVAGDWLGQLCFGLSIVGFFAAIAVALIHRGSRNRTASGVTCLVVGTIPLFSIRDLP